MYIEIVCSENSEIIPYKREPGKNLIVACPESFTLSAMSSAIKRYYCCSTCGSDITVSTRFRLRKSMSEALFTTGTNIWNKTIDVFYPRGRGSLDFVWKCMECRMGAEWIDDAMPKYKGLVEEDNETVDKSKSGSGRRGPAKGKVPVTRPWRVVPPPPPPLPHEDLVAPPMTIREQLLHAKAFRYPVVVICRRDVPTSYFGIVLEVQDEQYVLEIEDGKRRFPLDIADIEKVVPSVYYNTEA